MTDNCVDGLSGFFPVKILFFLLFHVLLILRRCLRRFFRFIIFRIVFAPRLPRALGGLSFSSSELELEEEEEEEEEEDEGEDDDEEESGLGCWS